MATVWTHTTHSNSRCTLPIAHTRPRRTPHLHQNPRPEQSEPLVALLLGSGGELQTSASTCSSVGLVCGDCEGKRPCSLALAMWGVVGKVNPCSQIELMDARATCLEASLLAQSTLPSERRQRSVHKTSLRWASTKLPSAAATSPTHMLRYLPC